FLRALQYSPRMLKNFLLVCLTAAALVLGLVEHGSREGEHAQAFVPLAFPLCSHRHGQNRLQIGWGGITRPAKRLSQAGGEGAAPRSRWANAATRQLRRDPARGIFACHFATPPPPGLCTFVLRERRQGLAQACKIVERDSYIERRSKVVFTR